MGPVCNRGESQQQFHKDSRWNVLTALRLQGWTSEVRFVLERLMGSCSAFGLNFVTVVVNTVTKFRTKTVELFLWSRNCAAAEGGLRLIPQT